ncbi:MAG: hypothetical protein EHM45_13325 [Desulfobacteraceae bacterium]|nr:MAG: hypothetical protein EHM45_13325 [Desulfobacteraceae bacterium]
MNQTDPKEMILIRSSSYDKPMSRPKKYALFVFFAFIILLPIVYGIRLIRPVWHQISGPILTDFFSKTAARNHEKSNGTVV